MITTRQNEPDKPSVHQYAVDYPCLAVDLAAANPRRNSLAEELREAARSRNTRIAIHQSVAAVHQPLSRSRNPPSGVRAPKTLQSSLFTLVLNQPNRPGDHSPWERSRCIAAR